MSQRQMKNREVVFPVSLSKKVSEYSDEEREQLLIARKNSKVVSANLNRAIHALRNIESHLDKQKPGAYLHFEYPNEDGTISLVDFGRKEIENGWEYIELVIAQLPLLNGRNASRQKPDNSQKAIFSGHNGGVVMISPSIRKWLQSRKFPEEVNRRLASKSSGISQGIIIEKLLSRLVNIYVKHNELNNTSVMNLSGEVNRAWFKPDKDMLEAFKGTPFLYKDDTGKYRVPQSDEERRINAYDRFIEVERQRNDERDSSDRKGDFDNIKQGFVRILSSTKSLLRPHQLSSNDIKHFGSDLAIDMDLASQLEKDRMTESLKQALTDDYEVINQYYEEHHIKPVKSD